MKCPVCKDITLLMSEKNWIEIDYCPECRWVWLDRWELEKLMNAEKIFNQNNHYNQNSEHSHHDKQKNYHNNDEDENYQNNTHWNNQKKKGFFEWFDLFD